MSSPPARGWSRRAVLAAVTAAAGCGAGRLRLPDVALPDGPAPDGGPPQQVLEQAAVSQDPQVRARALAALVRSRSTDTLLRWSTQGTYDPDPWVQARVMAALADRGDAIGRERLAVAFARRPADGDAVAAAVHRAMDAGWRLPDDVVSTVWTDQRPWRAASRALVAWRHGVASAADVVQAGLASGLVGESPAWLARLAMHGDPRWEAAARAGALRVEELAGSMALVRAAWGDPGARRQWLREVRSDDPFAARTAFDRGVALSAEAGAPWWSLGRRARDPAVTRAARALLKPSVSTLLRAVDTEGDYAGEVALRAVGRLEPAGRRAVLAQALTSPSDRLVEAAAVAIQTHRVEGLGTLLAPLSRHRRDVIRVAVAGALVLTVPEASR